MFGIRCFFSKFISHVLNPVGRCLQKTKKSNKSRLVHRIICHTFFGANLKNFNLKLKK